MQHTPGPYTIEAGNWENQFIVSKNLGWNIAIADMIANDPQRFVALHRDQIAANARLLAAAPDMFAALKAVQDARSEDELARVMGRVDAVIQKVEGGP